MMYKISYIELQQMMINFNPVFGIMMRHNLDLPRILSMAAEQCFIEQQLENETTKMIRHQLLYLKEYGFLDLI